MTNKEKYEAILEGLGELLQEKNNKISILEWQLEKVTKELETAEKSANKGIKFESVEIR